MFTDQYQIQLPSSAIYPNQDSSLTVHPSQYRTGHITQLSPSRTPVPLPVPHSQLYRDNLTSHVHQAVHPQPMQQPFNPAQVVECIPMHGYHNQSPSSPSIARTQTIPVHLSQPHQGRSATDDHHYSHDVLPLQPGLSPSYSAHVYPSTAQHPTLPNTQCYPPLLPVPPSQFHQESSTSHMHQAAHPLPTQKPLNPASPHVASDTGKPQVTPCVPKHGYHNQSPTPLLPPSIMRARPVPAIHQGRSVTPTLHNTPPLHVPIPLPVPPSLLYQDSSTSNVHPAVHHQQTHQYLDPASPHVASYTGQPQDIPMYGYHNQPPTPSLPPSMARTLPIHLSQPHQGRSATAYHHDSHAVQPEHMHRPSHQHPTLHNTQLPTHFHTPFVTPPSSDSYSCHPSQTLKSSQLLSDVSSPHTTKLSEVSSQPKQVHVIKGCDVVNGASVESSTPPDVDMYAKYLQGYYKSCGVVTEDTKWPPSPTVHYVNLAYISRSEVTKHEVDKITRAAVLGKIGDIVRVKKPLSFEDVACRLPNGSLPRIVLVEGAPGVGKTTFVWEACRRWGNGEILQQYSLVVVLRLRDKRIREASVLSDLFYHSNKALLQSVVQEIENNLGENLLLILEGLDELPKELREQSSIFLELIHGRLLPKATILITTRPWASVYLHEHCSRRIDQYIEILGFTRDQIDCYLESVLGSDSETLADINEYLTHFPQIHAAMTIPLNAAIVVCIYNESRTGKCILPQSMTELYTALAQTLLLRYVRDIPIQGKKVQLHQFIDLHVPPDVSKNFHKLSVIAYDGIKNDQQLIFSDLPRDFETLGFMQATPELYVSEGVHVSHNFQHLTIQEYLAAVYITQLSPEEQVQHFEGYTSNSGVFNVVMRFVAGLTKFSTILDCVRFVCGQNHYNPNIHTVNVHHVNWIFETQDPFIVNAILGSSSTIEFKAHYDSLMPFDYYCLGYCIAHSHSQWKLKFWRITEEDVKMLTAGASTLPSSTSTVKNIVLTSPSIDREVIYMLEKLPGFYRHRLSFGEPILRPLHGKTFFHRMSRRRMESIEMDPWSPYCPATSK